MTDDDLAWLLAVEEHDMDPDPEYVEAMKGTLLFHATRLRLACMEAVEAVRRDMQRWFRG